MKIKTRGKSEDNYCIRSEVSDAAVNEHLIERVDYIVSDNLLQDETFKYSQDEMLDLSETYRIALNMDKKQLAVFVVAALEKFPFMVIQCVGEAVVETLERGRK